MELLQTGCGRDLRRVVQEFFSRTFARCQRRLEKAFGALYRVLSRASLNARLSRVPFSRLARAILQSRRVSNAQERASLPWDLLSPSRVGSYRVCPSQKRSPPSLPDRPPSELVKSMITTNDSEIKTGARMQTCDFLWQGRGLLLSPIPSLPFVVARSSEVVSSSCSAHHPLCPLERRHLLHPCPCCRRVQRCRGAFIVVAFLL